MTIVAVLVVGLSVSRSFAPLSFFARSTVNNLFNKLITLPAMITSDGSSFAYLFALFLHETHT